MGINGFDRAQALYDAQEPPPRREIGGFGIGDRVKIDPFLVGEEIDGYDTSGRGEVIGFDSGYLIVRCGARDLTCIPEDLEARE